MTVSLKEATYMPTYLRKMQSTDLDELMKGELKAYPFPWTKTNFVDCLSNKAYSCWVFEQDKKLAGHVVISVVLQEAHILNICLYPEHQNKGWGRKLLSESGVIAEELGAETCFLEVRSSNKVGLHLYQSEAYNEIGIRKGYYPCENGREDAIVMAKTLVIKSMF